jgi:SAM-dependent methyltransferase
MSKVAPDCLLCGSSHVTIRHSLRSEEILQCWTIDDHQFSAGAVQSLVDEAMIHLYKCCRCGFEYFKPALAADAKFYEELQAGGSGYYADNRPENERNVRFALRRGFRTMLDVGCGPGFALDAGKWSGLQTYGMELSSTAAAAAAHRGHTIFPVLLEDLDSSWEGKFDLISFNQVLEHVPDPVGLIKQSIRFLSPRGAIAIAVPGANGILRFSPWMESNWPPHHISRWRKTDFDTLARRTDLKVIKTGSDQLLGSAVQSILLGHRQRCQILKKPHSSLPPACIRAFSFVYRKAGLKFIVPLGGHSIYCFLGR